MDKKALIFTISEGHRSIAQAANQILQQNSWQATTLNIFDKSKLNMATKFYKSFYRYAPSLFRIPFQLGQNIHLRIEIKRLLRKHLNKAVAKEIKDYQPQAIVSTYFGYNPSLTAVTPPEIKTINILANPWTIHPLEIEKGMTTTLAYDKKAMDTCLKMGLPKEKVKISGWFIRQQFYEDKKRSVQKLRQKLDFKEKIFTLVIVAGSEGSNSILKILPTLSSLSIPLQIAVIAGSNKLLFKTLSFLTKNFPSFKKKNLNIKIFGFTDAMADFMATSDLVVGKAGPNMVFESIALGKPFFAICHISGQEDGNLDIIREKKLGFVEENADKAGELLKKIIQHPQMLKDYQKNIEKERKHNHQAASVLMEAVKV